jgi:hypothetical protein
MVEGGCHVTCYEWYCTMRKMQAAHAEHSSLLNLLLILPPFLHETQTGSYTVPHSVTQQVFLITFSLRGSHITTNFNLPISVLNQDKIM